MRVGNPGGFAPSIASSVGFTKISISQYSLAVRADYRAHGERDGMFGRLDRLCLRDAEPTGDSRDATTSGYLVYAG